MDDLLQHMCNRALRHAQARGAETALPGVRFGVISHPDAAAPTACGSGVCLILQGTKHMVVGDRPIHYPAGHSFASMVTLPATRSGVWAGRQKPYVATSLTLDRGAICALLSELAPLPATGRTPAFTPVPVSRPLLEAWDRYLALLDSPGDCPILAPARERELLYRLLQSPHGPVLRQIARQDGRLSQIRHTLEWMQQHFHEPIPIRRLADTAQMSVASFNRHFKAATAVSPLQYLKMLRLQAARRRLSTASDVATAAFAVGYESASQFSREYSRFFGVSPKRDAALMRREAQGLAQEHPGWRGTS